MPLLPLWILFLIITMILLRTKCVFIFLLYCKTHLPGFLSGKIQTGLIALLAICPGEYCISVISTVLISWGWSPVKEQNILQE